jgi:hypothetical protein
LPRTAAAGAGCRPLAAAIDRFRWVSPGRRAW